MEDPAAAGWDSIVGGFVVTAPRLRLFKLQREDGTDRLGRPRRVILHGSTRHRPEDAEELARVELRETGIVWEVVSA